MTQPEQTPGPSPDFRRQMMNAAVLAGVATAIVAPFLWLGYASGHDFGFHASSWIDAAADWKQGLLYPRWNGFANYGFGEPRFIFYPPLSWMLGAALGSLLPWVAVPAAFIGIVQLLAGFCALALTRRLLTPGCALFAATAYAANPYALLIVYFRSDYAELLAIALFPLLLLAALELAGLLPSRRGPSRRVAVFAIVFALVWLSNAPAGVVASYTAALLLGFAALRQTSARPLLPGAGALALGFGLAGFYLVPAAYEQHWVDIAQVLSAGLLPSENFLFTFLPDIHHTYFNVIASGTAILMMLLAGAAALVSRHFRTGAPAQRDRNARVWALLLLLAGISCVLMLRMSTPLWDWLPKLRFVQFPWRWLAVLAVPLALLLGDAARALRRTWLGILVIALLLGAVEVAFARHAWWDSEDLRTLQTAVISDRGFEGTDEYDPAGDDHYNLPEDAPRAVLLGPGDDTADVPAVGAAIQEIQVWKDEFRKLRVTSDHPERLAVRLVNYPAWKVTVNGTPVSPERADDYNQMIIPLAAGTSEVIIRFVRTPDRTAGDALSLASLAVLVVLFVMPRRRFEAPAE